MSLRKVVTLHCDTPGCPEFTDAHSGIIDAAFHRMYARRDGWRRKERRDVCPKCAKSRQVSSE
jgi:hypothetical protein